MLNDDDNAVTITDVQIPMGSLIVLFIKMGIAAIPATIILVLVGVFAAAMLGGLGAGLMPHH